MHASPCKKAKNKTNKKTTGFNHCFVKYTWHWQRCRNPPRTFYKLLLCLHSKTYQSGWEMLLPCNHQYPPERLHSRAQVHPNTKLPLPSDVSITYFIYMCTLDLKHHVAFLFIGHFSPSILTERRDREKSCACMCTHTPLLSLTFTHTRTHTHTERKLFLPHAGKLVRRKCSIWVNCRGRQELKVTLFWTAVQ